MFELSATGKLQAGASCHPSTQICKMLFDKEESALAGAVKCPQLLCPAGNDPDTLKEGGAVVLSPGCASFDEFDNFEHRGRVFAALARGEKV